MKASIANKEDHIDIRDKRNYLKAIISGILRSTSSIPSTQLHGSPFIKIALTLNMNLIDKLIFVESILNDSLNDNQMMIDNYEEDKKQGLTLSS